MTPPREVELKLEVDAADIGPLTVAAVRGRTASTMLRSVYFDTPGQALRQAGFTLRVRHAGDRRVQTIKAESQVAAGLYDRPEWEHEIDSDGPVLTDPEHPLAATVDAKDIARIAPVFRSLIERTTGSVALDGALIEVAIDRGEVDADARRTPVCEIELELKQGSPAALFALARQLDTTAAVRLGVLTKAERGYRLLDRHDAHEAKAEPVVLDPELPVASAFQTIAWSCVRHFRLNETLLTGTGNAEALHQARVALRRLRSALSLFKPILVDDHFDAVRGELRWLAAALGEARDIDVLLRQPGAAPVLEQLQEARAHAYDRVQAALMSPRARGLMLDVAEWLAIGNWLTNPLTSKARHRPVALFAADTLGRLRRRLKRHGADLIGTDDDGRHATRLEAKKLRYASDFFAALYTGKKASLRLTAFRAALEALQGHLGDLNDEATAPVVLERLGLGQLDVTPRRAASNNTLGRAQAAFNQVLEARRFW